MVKVVSYQQLFLPGLPMSDPYVKVGLMMIYEILSVHPAATNYASFSNIVEAEIALQDKVRFPDGYGYRIFTNPRK